MLQIKTNLNSNNMRQEANYKHSISKTKSFPNIVEGKYEHNIRGLHLPSVKLKKNF